MSLWDKQQIWDDLRVTTKNGATMHLVAADDNQTLCGHTIRDTWFRTLGPLARYRTCRECETERIRLDGNGNMQ